jgi:hypothetical protein
MTITTGVLGGTWRADVTPWGRVEPWSGAPLDWFVAASDRWHVPSQEASVRQRRVDGTAVVETRVKVPQGDAVQRVWSVADAGGLTVVEVENESPSPIAVAFDRRDVRTERPVADVPIEGIDLPEAAFVVPVGHRAKVRVAIAHDGSGGGALAAVASSDRTASGWRAVLDRAGRLELPSAAETWDDLVAGERCEVLLVGPPSPHDAAGFLAGVGELVRLGEPAEAWVPDVAAAVERVASTSGWEVDAALRAAGRVLHAAGERRALGDLERIVRDRTPSPRPSPAPEGVTSVPWRLEQLACDGELLPAGIPADWLGAPVEVHGVPVGPASTVSFALRWHGERPAVLWEVAGADVELTAPAVAPGWRSTDRTGEALWPAPPQASNTTSSP